MSVHQIAQSYLKRTYPACASDHSHFWHVFYYVCQPLMPLTNKSLQHLAVIQHV
jgi:hypothetical protein